MADPLLTSLCSICHVSTPKYKCPRCNIQTCSLPCAKKHKAWSECSGRRDPTTYVPRSKLRTAAGVDHDYNFLHAIEVSVERSEKMLVEEKGLVQQAELRPLTIQQVRWKMGRDGRKRKVLVTRVLREAKGRTFEKGLAQRLKRLNVQIVCAPLGMARQRENSTKLNRRTGRINWQVEWLVVGGEKETARSLSKVMDDVPLFQAYPAMLEEKVRAETGSRKQERHMRAWDYTCLGERIPSSWPLATGSAAPSRTQTRKAAATYSPFPKLPSPPPTKNLPPIPVPKDKKPSRPSTSGGRTPVRPPRPAEALLAPCMQHIAFVPVSSAVADYIIQDPSPVSPTDDCRRPRTSCGQRPRKTADEASLNRRSHCTIYSVISHSATHLPVPEIRPSPPRAPRHFKSFAALPRVQTEQLTQEPHSVFEDDSDCEDGHSRKFFSFHKRSDSTYKRRRNRSNTTPTAQQKCAEKNDTPFLSSTSTHQKRHGHDVFGRLLGRRSR